MFKVIRKQTFSENVYLLEITQPAIAANGQPGQYVDIHMNPDTAIITLPIVDVDQENGTITVMEQARDLSSEQLMMLSEGDEVFKIKGPLGGVCEFDIRNKVLLVAENLGVASLLSRARAFKQKGVYTICIIGFPTQDDVYWADEFSSVADELYITTEDGSFGVSGKVTGPLKAVLETHKDVERVVMIGTLKNMKRGTKIASDLDVQMRISFDAIRTPAGSANIFDVADSSQEAFTFARAAEIDAGDIEFEKLIAKQRAIRNADDASAAQ